MAGVPNIVTRRLRSAADVGVHPDPDLLAAFVERSLAQREQSEVIGHLARCAECREVVALSLPEQPDAAALTSTTPARPGWLSWPVLRWGAAVACVVVVGAAISLHYESPRTRPASSVPISDVPIAQSKPVVKLPGEPASVASQAAEKTLSQNQLPHASSAVMKKSAPRKLAGPAVAQNSPSPTDQLQADRSAAPLGQETVEVTGVAPLAASVQPPAEMAQNIPGRAKDESEQSPTAKGSTVLGGGMARQTFTSSAMIARAAVVPANVTPRWILTSDGMLQRSIDSGKTWETILVASPGSFRALTANGFDIWVGGANGGLYHSIDAGQHWMRVQPMAGGAPLTADITGIEFNDLLHGSITTADKQTWTTADAGSTWTKQ
jgi:hypothetical protein